MNSSNEAVFQLDKNLKVHMTEVNHIYTIYKWVPWY